MGQRYNYPDDNNDRANCVAVDKRGNIYVAGNVETDSQQVNVIVHSYTALGSPRSGWPAEYNYSAENKDDYVTSIHVDDDFNVYVAGTSYGGTTSHYDFFVWKLNTNGGFVWPTSGGGTGYAFDSLGAIRTTSNQNEGFDAGLGSGEAGIRMDMAVRDSRIKQNRTIAVTGVAITTGFGALERRWRTIVFEQNSTGTSASIKSGWPVEDWINTTGGNASEAVAIHSDNSVYVTGLMYTDGSGGPALQQFTTIRYKAAGGSTPRHWAHFWVSTTGSKHSSGMDIVLDRDGNAFATGYMEESSVNYATVRIPRDWDENPNDTGLKKATWDNDDTDDKAASIDLSYEVESGVLKTYIYVTGTSDELISTSDIGTLRYSPNTSDQTLALGWTDVYSSSGSNDDVGLMVIGAGDGNAYVAGRSNNDYVLLAYTRTGAGRLYSPVVTDGGFSGLDESRALATGGAGLLLRTGTSFGGSTPELDFLTLQGSEGPVIFEPDANNIAEGVYVSGSLSDLLDADTSYRVYGTGTNDVGSERIIVELTATSPIEYFENPSEISITIQAKVSNPDVKMRVEAWNTVTGEYDDLDFRPLINSDLRLQLVIKDDPQRYINSSNDEVKLRLVFDEEEASLELFYWTVSLNQVTWEILD